MGVREILLCAALCTGCGADEQRSNSPAEGAPAQAPPEQGAAVSPRSQRAPEGASAEAPPEQGAAVSPRTAAVTDPAELVARTFAMVRALPGRIDTAQARAYYDAPADWPLAMPELGAMFGGEAERVRVELTWGQGSISNEYDATWALLIRFHFISRPAAPGWGAYQARLRALGFENREEPRPPDRDYARYRHRSASIELRVDEYVYEDETSYATTALFVWGHGLEIPFDRLGDETLTALARLPGARTVSLERNAAPTRDYPEVAIDVFDRVACVAGPERTLLIAQFDGLAANSPFPNPSEQQIAHYRAPSATADGIVIKRNQACLFGGQRIACERCP